MKLITINERAAAAAIDFTVGPEKRMAIENLYTLLDNAEKQGRADGWEDGFKIGAQTIECAAEQEWQDGFDQGYEAAMSIFTGAAPQPDPRFCEDQEYLVVGSPGTIAGSEYQRAFIDDFQRAFIDDFDAFEEMPEEAFSLDDLKAAQQDDYVAKPTTPFGWSPGPLDTTIR
jgi:hypothetical protein